LVIAAQAHPEAERFEIWSQDEARGRRWRASRDISAPASRKLVRAFADAVFEVIEQEPNRLREVTGIGPKRAERIIAGWAEQKVIREIMLFLGGTRSGSIFGCMVLVPSGPIHDASRDVMLSIRQPPTASPSLTLNGFSPFTVKIAIRQPGSAMIAVSLVLVRSESAAVAMGPWGERRVLHSTRRRQNRRLMSSQLEPPIRRSPKLGGSLICQPALSLRWRGACSSRTSHLVRGRPLGD
jgi:hypothetical protein